MLTLKIGVPTGIRTPVAAVKGRRPRPLDDGDLDKNKMIVAPHAANYRDMSYSTYLTYRILAGLPGLEPGTL